MSASDSPRSRHPNKSGEILDVWDNVAACLDNVDRLSGLSPVVEAYNGRHEVVDRRSGLHRSASFGIRRLSDKAH